MKISHLNWKPLYRGACALVWVTAAVITPVASVRAAYEASTAIDPPARVGRLSDITGKVWMFSPGSGEWVAAVRNQPLTSGDRLSTDAAARAEVHIGSTTVRLDSGSELEVLQLDDNRMALQLHSGSTSVRLRQRDSAAQFELRTAEGRFRVQRTGRYRFDRQDETSQVTVWSGQAYFEGPGSALTVVSGQRAEFWLDNRNAAQYSLTEPVRDAFAAYNNDRDQRDDRSASARYVSPEMTGIEDLDRNGRWEQNSDYGPLWIPRVVAPGWAPYAAGHWAFVRPWGWTWIDDAPWGFAPFHYGRWVFLRDTWCWAPGTFVARPVYAPALVAWVGGPRVSVGISVGGNFGGSVGWFPLAPREVYVPSYRVSPRYVEQVNITHVTNITNITTIINNPQAAVRDMDFANRKFHHAVTTVPEAVMTGRGNVAPAAAQWRAANPGRAEGVGGENGEDRIDRSGRRADPNRNAPPSAPVMTMAAPPVATPTMAPAISTMSAPPTPSRMSRPEGRANEEIAPPQRAAVERQGGARERAGDSDRPNRAVSGAVSGAVPGATPGAAALAPLPAPSPTPSAVVNSAPAPAQVPAAAPVMSRPAPTPAAPSRIEPRAVPPRAAAPAVVTPATPATPPTPTAPPALAAPAAPGAAPRMEGPRGPARETENRAPAREAEPRARAPAREAVSAEGRKSSQEEKGEGRRNNSPRAVE